MHTGSLGYAAQTYSLTGDDRRINVTWERVNFPGNVPFCSQMGIPVTHVLRRDENGFYLHASPIREAKKLRGTAYALQPTACGYMTVLTDTANELSLTVPAQGGEITVSMLGFTVVIDRAAKEARLNGQTLPLGVVDGHIKLRMYIDTCSAELFSETHYACFAVTADENLSALRLDGEPEADLYVWPMSRTHS